MTDLDKVSPTPLQPINAQLPLVPNLDRREARHLVSFVHILDRDHLVLAIVVGG